MSRALGAVLALLGILYPYLVYVSLDTWQPAWLAAATALLWTARGVHQRLYGNRASLWMPALAGLGCAIVALEGSATSLRWYPVMMNGLMLALFGSSLLSGQRPVIERVARLRQPDLPEAGVRYTRRVTQVWCAFFILNGALATGLALWGSWQAWTWYNGGASYVLIGLLIAGEWLVRPSSSPKPQDS
ncbi:FIG017861: hypothetical protein [plant metagenome]|uniref:DNA gyrase subunit B n=1 Tax=plant metagenome TaxID=1297885 RepID=A0A484PWC4_9ZZZZ